MLGLLRGVVPETLWPLVFVVVFLVIGGGALWLTPRIAHWLEKQEKAHPSYYDGMLESDPNDPAEPEDQEKED